MSKGTRNTWMAALLALALGSGELVAYHGIAPHAKALLSGDRSRAVLRAGEIVAWNLSALVVGQAQQAAGAIAMYAVKQTSQVYRLAARAPEAAEHGSLAAVGRAAATEASANPEGCAVGGPECSGGTSGAVVASEPDAPCATSQGREAGLGAGSACPACPACPARPARTSAFNAGAPFGWTGMSRALVILGV